MKNIDFFLEAMRQLYPGIGFAILTDGGICWEAGSPPLEYNEENVLAKSIELEVAHEALQYARNRAAEYPPVTDYLDGIVKGDNEQVQAYIKACLAIKEKYPKPE